MPAPDFADEIAALTSAAASGELTVESDGDRVTYRNMGELMKALEFFEARARSASGRGGGSVSLAVYCGD